MIPQIPETWHEAFPGAIPQDTYTLHLLHGERQGLTVLLEGNSHNVTLTFGNVQAANILDEGVQLGGPGITNHTQLRSSNFAATLYLVENGCYTAHIKSLMSSDLYEALHLRQYVLVTLNYVVEIVTGFEPTIQVHTK